MIKELYHCTPQEFDKIDEYTINLHWQILSMERKQERLKMKRIEQKNNIK
jgi:hypothetical protein